MSDKQHELKQALFSRAREYAEITGLSIATVSRKASGDARFFKRIEDGAGFTVGRFDTVMRWFDDNWPQEQPAD